MIRIKDLHLLRCKADLGGLKKGKLLINTINAFSFVNARKDPAFAEALLKGDILLPDGAGIVRACKWLNIPHRPFERIAGADLFIHEMGRVNAIGRENAEGMSDNGESTSRVKPVVMFMGSSEKVLALIKKKASEVYPYIDIVTYSPPYKPEFSEEDNRDIINSINTTDPDLLWIGMTAPKQEKWTYQHWDELNIHCHVGTIGAVFDFFAGTIRRAPVSWQEKDMEWLFRLREEPRRMWRRYLIGNTRFLWHVFKEFRSSRK